MFGSIPKSKFLKSFWCILMQFLYFYAVKSFICINFCKIHVYKWENAYSRDLNAEGILMDFYIFIKVNKA